MKDDVSAAAGTGPGSMRSVAFLPDFYRQPSSKLFLTRPGPLLQAGWQGHPSGPREDAQFSSHTDMETEPREQPDFPGPTGDEEQG